ILDLDRANVRVISYCEPWLDQRGPVRDLLIYIFSWIAEQGRNRLGERTRAGLARAKAKGVKLGRPGRASTSRSCSGSPARGCALVTGLPPTPRVVEHVATEWRKPR